jgi:alkylation response protein AidB-like acyl-CoA dehydrogenase
MRAEARENVAAEIHAWLREHWDPTLALVEWRNLLAAAGWVKPSWPVGLGGRGLPEWTDGVVAAALAEIDAPGPPAGAGMALAAATILEHGSADVQQRFVPRTITGEFMWCQLFSEPGAGSDLAGVTTHAAPDGDSWIVNGQKVWNTSAHHADYGILVARTDWDAPKHRGLTYFVLPMRQPGVTVRPLRQMNGHASFNEVFLDDAVIPPGHVVGDVGSGWTVALTTLAHERAGFRRIMPVTRTVTDNSPGNGDSAAGRARAEADVERIVASEPYTWYPQRTGRVDLLPERARAHRVAGDPVVRQEIARVHTLSRVADWTASRAAAARSLGRPPGPEGSIGKLAVSGIARAAARAHALIAGAAGLLSGADGPVDGVIAEILVSVPAASIAGGTDEIQHNILAERVLGLPKEPDMSATIPFRDVPRNPHR